MLYGCLGSIEKGSVKPISKPQLSSRPRLCALIVLNMDIRRWPCAFIIGIFGIAVTSSVSSYKFLEVTHLQKFRSVSVLLSPGVFSMASWSKSLPTSAELINYCLSLSACTGNKRCRQLSCDDGHAICCAIGHVLMHIGPNPGGKL